MYKYVNKKLKGSSGIVSIRNKDGQLLYGNSEKSCLLNDYFGSVFTNDSGITDPVRLLNKANAKMSPVIIIPDLVLKEKNIKQLKRNSSGGPECIPAEFYKGNCSFFAFPLSIVFNVSLQSGDLPLVEVCCCNSGNVFKKVSSIRIIFVIISTNTAIS